MRPQSAGALLELISAFIFGDWLLSYFAPHIIRK
jgi:hypothetical protein